MAPLMLNENSSDESLGVVFDSYGNVAYCRAMSPSAETVPMAGMEAASCPPQPLSPTPHSVHQTSSGGGEKLGGEPRYVPDHFQISSHHALPEGSADHIYTMPSDPRQSPHFPRRSSSGLNLSILGEPLSPTRSAVLGHRSAASTTLAGEWESRGAASRTITSPDGESVTVRRTVKDFTFGHSLGDGSYSTVVLGTDRHTQTQYAIKTLDKRHIIKEKKVKYVNIEKNALNRLGKRDGIVHLFFTFQDEQSLYFVLEYAPYGELLSLVKKYGSLNESAVRHYGAQMVDAIKFMHLQGVIHRDIKPENILLDAHQRITITDFGTAKLLEKENGKYPVDCKATSFVGTAEYVSPELLNDKYTGKASDWWAFGCILFQLIAGKPPFKATNEYLTFQKITKLQYAFTAGFPLVVRDLVKGLLKTKPQERLSVRGIQAHYFFNAIDWSNHDAVWNSPVPELGPYKVNPKSMMPIPQLSKPAVRTQRSAALLRQTDEKPPVMRSASAPTTPTPNTLANPTFNGAANSLFSEATPNLLPKGAFINPSLVAINGEASVTGPVSAGVLSPRANALASSGASAAMASAGAPAPRNGSTPRTTAAPRSGASPNYIPGTTILRPQAMSIRHPTAWRVATAPASVPPPAQPASMSALDIKWCDYFRNRDERVLKVGTVLVTQTTVELFEKRYKGSLADSPLGYRSGSSSSSLLTQVVHGNSNGLRNLKHATEGESSPEDESEAILLNNLETDPGPATVASSSRFKKIFHSQLPVLEAPPVRQRRTLLITSFGRALLLSSADGVTQQLRTELQLSHPLIRFKEVISDRRTKQSHLGVIAIECHHTCFVFEVDKLDVAAWTGSLARLRTTEHERLQRVAMEGEGLGGTAAQEAAMTAAVYAVSPTRDVPTKLVKAHHQPSDTVTPVAPSPEVPALERASGEGFKGVSRSPGDPSRRFYRTSTTKTSPTGELTTGTLVNGLPVESGSRGYGLQAATVASAAQPTYTEGRRSSFTKSSLGAVLSGFGFRKH